MSRSSQDIYRSREKDRELIAVQDKVGSRRTWFLNATDSRHRPVIAIILFLAGFLAISALVISYQHSVLREVRDAGLADPGPEPQFAVRPARRFAVEIDPGGEVVIDDLGDVPLREIPEEPPAILTADWVKQAAAHLRNAERAYEELRWAESIHHYRQAQRILPDLEDLDRRIGLAQLRMEDFEGAEVSFLAEAKRQPESAAAFNNLGVSRMGQGRREAAEQDLLAALGRNPQHGPARRNLALLYFGAGRPEEAVEALDQALAIYPNDSELLHMQAVILIRLERWSEASALLEDTVQRMPEAVPILFRLAEVRAHSRDERGALEALGRAVRLVDAQRALLWISRLTFDPLRENPDFQALLHDLSQAVR